MEVGWFERPEFKNLVEGIWKNWNNDLPATILEFIARAKWWS